MTKEDFLKAIAANEDDITTRLVYSDWLEERGMIDEAQRQRAWIPAKQELIDLMELRTEEYDPEQHGYYDPPMSFKEFIERLTEQHNNIYIRFGSDEHRMELYHMSMERVWRLWSIITGGTPPIELLYGGCAC